ncbi:MAG: hypothetical protein AB7S39_03295 [Gemmatimonadales bacterium]
MNSFRLLALLGCGAALACTTDSTQAPVAAGLAMAVQPSGQAASGAAFDQQPVVSVQDQSGQPFAARSVEVTATVTGGGATLIGTTSVRTDDQGRATFGDLGLRGPAGQYTVRFAAPGLTAVSASPVNLGAGAAAVLEVSGGDNQVALAGTAVSVAPAVRVTDGAGNPIAGVAVTFVIDAGGGTVSGPDATTGADGVARAAGWVLGPVVGLNRLRATAAGGLAATLSAVGVLGPAAKLVVESGDAQDGVVGRAVPDTVTLRLTDAFDNPVPGVLVTVAVANGGSVTLNRTTTDSAGRIRAVVWTLGLVPGPQSFTASISGGLSVTVTAEAGAFAVAAIGVGSAASCALDQAGAAWCWGANDRGQAGTGNLDETPRPALVQGGLTFTSVVTGGEFACGLTAAGEAYCWGANDVGQLGDGTGTDSAVPVAVAGGHAFTQITAGAFHACGVDAVGDAWCWGFNANGQLGIGTTQAQAAPELVQGFVVYTAIAAGGGHTCALLDTGEADCWGAGANGRLGNGATTDRVTPAVVNLPAGVTLAKITTGGVHTCGLTGAGTLYCWGLGSGGALGTGTTTQRTTPTAVAGAETFASVDAGFNHTCGITMGGALFCWGLNSLGQVGDGSVVNRTAPVAVAAGSAFASVSAGDDHSCARLVSGAALCWGGNTRSQLGDGATIPRLKPGGVDQP